MRRKERLLSQIAEVEVRLGIGAAPARPAGGSDEAGGGASTPRRPLPPVSPLSPLSPPRTVSKPAANEVELLQQVESCAIGLPEFPQLAAVTMLPSRRPRCRLVREAERVLWH